jgi:hypothetical protein
MPAPTRVRNALPSVRSASIAAGARPRRHGDCAGAWRAQRRCTRDAFVRGSGTLCGGRLPIPPVCAQAPPVSERAGPVRGQSRGAENVRISCVQRERGAGGLRGPAGPVHFVSGLLRSMEKSSYGNGLDDAQQQKYMLDSVVIRAYKRLTIRTYAALDGPIPRCGSISCGPTFASIHRGAPR